MIFLKNHYAFLLIFLFAAALLSTNLTKPFIGHHDWNGAWYANIARNFVRYGFLQTKFGSVLNYDRAIPSEFAYNTHYPLGLPVILAISFSIFGISDWSARLVPYLASLATTFMIYLLGIYFFDKKTAILASALTSLVPIVIYFAKVPVHEILIFPFALLSIFLYFKFFKEQNLKNFLQLAISLVVSHQVHWSAYFVTPLFFLSYWIFKKRFLIAALFPILSLLMFVLYLLHVKWLTGSMLGGGLLDILLDRLNITDRPAEYSTINFAVQRWHLLVAYFTWPILVLAAPTAIWLIIQIRKGIFDQKVQLLLMLGVFGITYNVIFRNAAFIHDYTIIYALPVLVLSAARGFVTVTEFLKPNRLQILLLSFLLIILILAEGKDFTRALVSTESFAPGVNLGKIISVRTQSGDKILVLSLDFKKYFEVQTAFYADRIIGYQLLQPEELRDAALISQYKLIVAIPSRDTPQDSIDILNSYRQPNIINEFVIYEN